VGAVLALKPRLQVDPLSLVREAPDTALTAAFDGEPMVQSFAVPLPGGRTGRAWITTAEALTVPGFGRPWVAAQLRDADPEALAAGLRLRPAAVAAELPLAA
jgi:hypothetical protein